MFKSYDETVKFLYDNLPMFQRIGPAALKPDLTNTIRLCAALGNPHLKFRSIHIAGTNGKGSTSHMLASILQECGYKTGLYTSPHLREFTERVRIDGMEIQRSFIVDFVNRIYPHIVAIQPSFFEITVALAFDYFATAGVHIAVIETGLGGRLDSTNVITPMLSIITNIGWDHKDILGDTLEKIAEEKAGIIKDGIPVVVSERQESIDKIFIDRSESLGAPLTFATDHYTVGLSQLMGHTKLSIEKEGRIVFKDLEIPLQGFYQRKNVGGVLQAVDVLNKLGLGVDQDSMVRGLDNVVTNTGLRGRWQVLSRNPLIVCDTAHNVDGIKEVVVQIRDQSYNKLHVVLGMVKDKDITSILALLPKEATYYFCQANIPRALNATNLAEQAVHKGLHGQTIPDVNDAIAAAERNARADDMIFIGGSTFVVAEIKNL